MKLVTLDFVIFGDVDFNISLPNIKTSSYPTLLYCFTWTFFIQKYSMVFVKIQ